MNSIFNLIWSKTKERWIVVSEKVKGNGKVPSSPLRSIAALAAMFAAVGPAYALEPGALPTGGQVTSGNATIATSGSQMRVDQSSQRMIANWQSFNIGQSAAVRFNQPGTSASALNRITDQNPTQIMGSLSANGQVFLLNPSGIIFGKTASVNVGGLVATSLNMLDSDYLAGKYSFNNQGSAGAILNQGSIKIADGGVVALMAPRVSNEGSITVNRGSALLAAGNQVTLDFTGSGLIRYTVDHGAIDALVENKGLVRADGGVVVMTAKAANALKTASVTNSGVVEARTIESNGGRILLLSDMESGVTDVSGTLDASAPNGGDGGFVETSGSQVNIADGAHITTAAASGQSGTFLLDPYDFTVAATGGNISGAALGNLLNSNSVTIQTATGTDSATNRYTSTNGNGDIFVNDPVSWSANNMLTLNAWRNITINANITASGATGALALSYGQGAAAAGNTATYTLGSGSTISLLAFTATANSGNFSTKLGNNVNVTYYTVITSLGGAAEATTSPAIMTLQGMAASNTHANLSGNYVLGGNIDATGTPGWDSNLGFAPIGNNANKFTGIFDGLGHTITGLTINRPEAEYVGLFGYVTGIIRNVGLAGATVRGSTIVGGLIGQNDGNISNSYATGSVTGSTSSVGGLIGLNVGSISNSYSTGSVTGTTNVGGLVGQANTGSSISNSYATGSVTGSGNSSNVGGLAGQINAGSISNSYSTGSVTGTASVGGLVGQNVAGSISASYWDNVLSLRSVGIGGTGASQAGVTGLSSTEMMTMSNFAWGAAISNTGGSSAVWRIYEGHTAPLLRSFLTTLTLADVSTSYNGVSQSGTTTTTLGVSGTAASGTSAGIYNTGYYSTQQGYDVIGGNLTVNKANLTLSGSRIYDGTKVVDGSVLTAAGVNGEKFSVSGSGDTSNLTSKDVQTSSTLASVTGLSLGTGSGGGVSSNYNALSTTGSSVTINKANLTLNGSRLYDGTTVVDGSVLTAAGVNSEKFGVSGSGDTSNLTSKDVQTGSTLASVTGLSLGTGSGGGVSSNYDALSTTGSSVTINKATVTLGTATKTYNGLTDTGNTSVAISGAGNETLGFTSATYLSKDVADNAANYLTALTLSDNGTSLASNYQLPTMDRANAPSTIRQKAIGLTASRMYDGSTSFSADSAMLTEADKADSDVVTISSGTAEVLSANAATYSGFATNGLVLSNSNYTLTAGLVSATISPALLSIGSGDVTRVYDGSLTAAGSAIVTGGTLYTNASNGSATDTLSGGTFAFTDANAGAGNKIVTTTAVMVSDGNSGGNYTVSYTDNTTSTITPAHLTVTADNQTRLYGGVNPTFSETISGFVNGETSAVVSGTAVGSSTATVATGVGSVAIVASAAGLTANNYDFIEVNGVLTIIPALSPVIELDSGITNPGATNPGGPALITYFAGSGSSSGTSGTATGGATSRGDISSAGAIMVTLVSPSTPQAAGLINIKVSNQLLYSGSAFRISLPADVTDTMAATNTVGQFSLAGGASLPGWIKYDAQTKLFVVDQVPEGAFPLTVQIQVGDLSWDVVISSDGVN